jgi:hypothetical protein
MSRPDLLALTPDDLAALTNRGTVKRAQREVEENEFTAELAEDPDGTVTARWSDGAECRLPAGAVLADGRCSCAATGLCRHLVRTVLAYQNRTAQAPAPNGGTGVPPVVPPPAVRPSWDPGAIADDELARHYRPAAFAKLREEFRRGVLVELVRGAKPSARFHLQACLLRFLVPGDVRYTHCDCADPAPCPHVPLAVWAFRRLDPSRQAGVIASAETAPPVPVALLDALEAAALELCEFGVSGAPAAWADRLMRLEEACRGGDLVWPAEVLAELHEQRERYAAHDALFAPERVADLLGELLVRCDAIRRDTGALPQLLIRGPSSNRPMAIGSARLIGLGCGVRAARKRVEMTVYLQDTDSGGMVAFGRDFADEEGQEPRPFAELARVTALKRSTFAAVGAGQILLRGGKRTAGFRLLPARAEASVQPQAFAWEALRPPVLVEDFAELDARLDALPPASLRPRRVAEDFHVLPVAGVEAARFDGPTQCVEAVLRDAGGRGVLLSHPYTSRGRDGAEALLARLLAAPDKLRFVSGPVRRSAAGLLVRPVCLVWQDGTTRTALQPWIERRPADAAAEEPIEAGRPAADPVAEYLRRLQEELGELFVLGLRRADERSAARWDELRRQGEAVGLTRLAGQTGELAGALRRKAHALDWDWRSAAPALLRLAVLARAAQDLLSA